MSILFDEENSLKYWIVEERLNLIYRNHIHWSIQIEFVRAGALYWLNIFNQSFNFYRYRKHLSKLDLKKVLLWQLIHGSNIKRSTLLVELFKFALGLINFFPLFAICQLGQVFAHTFFKKIYALFLNVHILILSDRLTESVTPQFTSCFS